MHLGSRFIPLPLSRLLQQKKKQPVEPSKQLSTRIRQSFRRLISQNYMNIFTKIVRV